MGGGALRTATKAAIAERWVYFTNLRNSNTGSQISDSGSTTLVASMPKHAVQAFSLLQGCPEAQSVVTSIASDPNAWNAVLKNNEVMSFISKQQSATLPNEGAEYTTKPSMFADIMQNIKARVFLLLNKMRTDNTKEGVCFTNLENSKTGSQISNLGSTTLVASMPKHAVQAFSLLQGCPEAQSVVASIASDPNVYNAVLKNNDLMSFISKQQSAILPNEGAESTDENDCSESVSSPDKDTTKPSMFADIMQNVKSKVSAVVSNISDLVNDFMGPSSDGAPGTKSDKGFFGESSLGASFMALALAVILVVLLKRG